MCTFIISCKITFINIYETTVVKNSNSLINHNFNYHQDECIQHKQN